MDYFDDGKLVGIHSFTGSLRIHGPKFHHELARGAPQTQHAHSPAFRRTIIKMEILFARTFCRHDANLISPAICRPVSGPPVLFLVAHADTRLNGTAVNCPCLCSMSHTHLSVSLQTNCSQIKSLSVYCSFCLQPNVKPSRNETITVIQLELQVRLLKLLFCSLTILIHIIYIILHRHLNEVIMQFSEFCFTDLLAFLKIFMFIHKKAPR